MSALLILGHALREKYMERTLHEYTARPLPILTRLLDNVRGLLRRREPARKIEYRLKHADFTMQRWWARQGSNL
jgi:hypothetical protein